MVRDGDGRSGYGAQGAAGGDGDWPVWRRVLGFDELNDEQFAIVKWAVEHPNGRMRVGTSGRFILVDAQSGAADGEPARQVEPTDGASLFGAAFDDDAITVERPAGEYTRTANGIRFRPAQ